MNKKGGKGRSSREELEASDSEQAVMSDATVYSQAQMVESMANLMREQAIIMERLQKERDEREERLQKEREEREERMLREQLIQQEKWNEMQKEAVEKRIQHEMEMLRMQQDFEDKKRKAEQKSKVADKLVKWEDRDQPQDYLIRFEDTMKQAGIPEEQWPHRLRPLLSGRALVAYSRDVSDEAKMSYQDLNDALLDSLGMPVKQCRERIWSFQRTGSDSHHDTARKLEFVMQRAAHGCGSVQEVVTKLTMAKFLTLYPSHVANYVQLNKPRSVGDAANLVQEFYQRQQSRDHGRYYSSRPWTRNYDRSAGGSRDDPHKTDGAPRETEKQGEFNKGYDSSKGSGNTVRGSFRQGIGFGQGEHREWRDRVPTCYSCGKKGHKRPECPNKVARVVSPVRRASLRVDGCVGEHECQMTIDTGAQKTVVKADLVKPEEYTGKSIRLLGFDGGAVTVPLAKVWLHIGEYAIQHVVAVCDEPSEEALLGLDIGMLDYLMQLEKESERERNKCSVNITTRAQAKAHKEQEKRDADLSERDQANPTPLEFEPEIERDVDSEIGVEVETESERELDEIDETVVETELDEIDDESVVETDTECPQAEEPGVDEAEIAKPILLEEVEDSEEMPIPALDEKQEDKALLREQQQHDESLMSVRGWAEKDEKGYGYQDGLLVHVCEGKTGEQLVRIVVPDCRHRKVLQVSHSGLTGAGTFLEQEDRGSP